MTSKPTIPFNIWEQCDLRVGKITHVDDHPKADKLYVLTVDFGPLGERTIVAGIKKHYEKTTLKGRLGVFIVNLEPVVLRGVKSEGMTLAAVNSDESIVTILSPEKHLEPGSIIR